MSLSVSLVLDADAEYDTHLPPWQPGGRGVRQAVQIKGRGWEFTTIQGTAAQLRALAAALNEGAGQADAWAAAQPGPDAEAGAS